jgi:hypothetical protein
VNHALVGPTGFSCTSTIGFRYPAVKSDGLSTVSYCMPEGARVQLDPTFDCNTVTIAWEKIVCRTLQLYGWYNIDNGNVGNPGFGVQFENPAGETTPSIYPADYAHTTQIPLNRLRVLASWNGM